MSTVGGLISAKVEMGRVLDVDIDTYTLAVTTQFSRKPQTGISWASPYQHFVNGEGIYAMPEVGSLCWICFPSDGNKPFVMAWAAAAEEGNFKSNKRDLNPGDIFLGTRDDNAIILKRGGVIQITSTALCQRLFLPINNTIKDFCENYGLHSLGGDLEWSVGRSETDKDGKRPTTLSLKARQYANDSSHIASLEIGSHDGDEQRILSLKVKASPDGDTVISLFADKEGNLSWTCKKDVSWKVDGNYLLTVGGDFNANVSGNVVINGNSITLKSKAGGFTLEAGTGPIHIKGAPLVKIDSTVQAGGTGPVALAGPLLTWLALHIHNITASAPGSPTTPPTIPPPGTIVSSSLFAG